MKLYCTIIGTIISYCIQYHHLKIRFAKQIFPLLSCCAMRALFCLHFHFILMIYIRPYSVDRQYCIHFDDLIMGAAVIVRPVGEGHKGASHPAQAPGRWWLHYILSLFNQSLLCTGGWQPAANRYTKHRNPGKTNGPTNKTLKWEINFKKSSCQAFTSGI